MVAFLACMEVIGSGYQVSVFGLLLIHFSFYIVKGLVCLTGLLYLQAAFMVPTELLAIQHYEHLLGLLEKLEDANQKPSVALLTGSTSMKQAKFIRQVFADHPCLFLT